MRDPFRDYLATVVTDEEFDDALRASRRVRNPRVASWLYDYEDEELNRSHQCYEDQAPKGRINIRDFFSDIPLKRPYCDRLPGVPIWVLLPFYNQVIVWLEPFRSSAIFTRMYGVDPHTFADLCGPRVGDGRIIPILNASPPAFSGLKHFERILAFRPPTLWRDFFFQRALVGASAFAQARRDADRLIPKRIRGRTQFASLRGTARGSVRDLAVSCYCQVCAFGGSRLAELAVTRSRSDGAMVARLFYYSLALYDSFVSPLGGTYPCTREQLMGFGHAAGHSANQEVFPVEIGTTIIDNLQLPMPLVRCNREWWLTEARDLWRPAREALWALEEALDAPAASNVLPRRDNLLHIWKEVAAEIRRSHALKRRFAWMSSGIGIMGTIAGTLLPPAPGLVASLVGSTASLSLFDIKGVYERLVRPRHLVALVALQDYVAAHPLVGCP